jgi:hypothetical protein
VLLEVADRVSIVFVLIYVTGGSEAAVDTID